MTAVTPTTSRESHVEAEGRRVRYVEAGQGPNPGRLAGVTVPTLVVCGTRDEGVAPAAGRGCRASMPNCHLVFVYEAGPAVGAERPEAYAEVVADFLDRHEGFVVRRTPALIHP